MLPLAFALGAGAEMRAPMARAVVGGLITSTLLTLLVVPVVYTVLDDFSAWLRRRWHGEASAKVVAMLLGALLAAPAAHAQQPRADVLTLERALRIAAEQNRDIQKARSYQQWVRGKYLEERAAALPQLKLEAANMRQSDSSLSAFFQGFFPTTQDVRTVELGVTQPLFTWGKVGAAVRAAKEGLQTAEDQLSFYRQAAARDVTIAFYDVLLARELNRIAMQNLKQKERHLEEAKNKYALGTATDYDVLAAEVGVKNARPEVIRTENLIRTTRERLNFLLAGEAEGLPVEGTLLAEVAAPPSHDEVIASAWNNRPELAELKHRANVARELVRIERAGDKPQVEFRGGLGWKQLAAGGLQGTGRTWNVGVYLTFPFYDGLRSHGRTVQAESEQRTLDVETQKTRDAIRLESRTAVDAVHEAQSILTALGGTVEQARRLLFMAEQGFGFGVKTRLDVDDAQLNLSQAEANLARAQRDYLVAQVTLEWVKGTL